MISVIIPNYNHALYLRQRIDSVLNQTYRNFELIILDDNSTDHSVDIIEQYKNHSKISHIIGNKENSGSVFQQWSKGIEVAKGEYIWIAESDDFADPEFLEELLPIIENDNDIGIVYSDSTIVDETGNSIGETFSNRRNKKYHTSKWSNSYVLDGKMEIEENLIRGCTINNASSVLFRKEALISIFPLSLDLKYIGDWYCYLQILQKYKLAYYAKPLNYYREHSVNASKSLSNNLLYVKEYFQLYNWALTSINYIRKESIIEPFLIFTRHDGLRGFNTKRLIMYKSFYELNPYLFWRLFKNNFLSPYFHRLFIHF